jgi:hypothetical protein
VSSARYLKADYIAALREQLIALDQLLQGTRQGLLLVNERADHLMLGRRFRHVVSLSTTCSGCLVLFAYRAEGFESIRVQMRLNKNLAATPILQFRALREDPGE